MIHGNADTLLHATDYIIPSVMAHYEQASHDTYLRSLDWKTQCSVTLAYLHLHRDTLSCDEIITQFGGMSMQAAIQAELQGVPRKEIKKYLDGYYVKLDDILAQKKRVM